ncbi:MAG TPA: ATP-grasp domain-containing protein [Candidatus Kryptonia bacterium]
MNGDQITVLISGAGTATCQSVIKGLRKQTSYKLLRIITYDMNPENAGKFMSDEFCTVPAASDPDFMKRIGNIVRECKVDAVIPIVDWEFRKLSESREDFLKTLGCRIVISSPETVDICDDKLMMNRFLTGIGIHTPKVFSAGEAAKLSVPFIVKPQINGRGSIDVYKTRSREELAFYLKKIQNPLITECLEGEEFTIDLMFDFNSRPVAGLVRKRIETKGGLAYKAEVVLDDGALKEAYKIGEALRVIGPANMQFIKTASGNYFFDLNPRFSGALACTIGAGLNTPLLLLHILKQREIPPEDLNYKLVRMYRYWNEFFSQPD